MKTLSFISQKGGTGKTTLALNVALEAMAAGLTVAVIDLDPQPSACAWADLRGEGRQPIVIDAKPARLKAAVQAAREIGGLDLMIIDTGGRTEEGAYAAAKASDLVVVPLQASAVDLKSVPATRELLAMAGNPDTVAVLTRVKPIGTRHAETASWLVANGMAVCHTTIGDRVTYQDSYALGRTVAEYDPTSKAAEELAAVTADILTRLGLSACRHNNNITIRGDDNDSKETQSRRLG